MHKASCMWAWPALAVLALFGPVWAQQPITPPLRPGFPVTLPGSGYISALAVGDLDGDGVKEIIVGTRNRLLYVLRADGTPFPGAWPQPLPGMPAAQPVVANLDGTGPKIIVATGSTLDPGGAGSVSVFDPHGTLLWRRFPLDGTGDGIPEGIFSSPAVGNLNGDGRLVIVVGSFDQRVYAFRADGSDLPGWPVFVSDSVWSSPALADLDGDGRLEVIIGIDTHATPGVPAPLGPCNPFASPPITPNGGALVVLYSNGTPYPGFPICIDETIMSSPAVGDIEGNGIPDIVVGTGGFWSSQTGLPLGRQVHAYRRDGTKVPGWPKNVGGTVFSSPALADLDGDGVLDVVVGSSDSFLYAFKGNNGNGPPLFVAQPKSFLGTTVNPLNASPIVADVNGDGQPEVLIAVQSELAVLNRFGVQLTEDGSHVGGKLTYYTDTAVNAPPIVTDLDNNGVLDVIIGSATPFPDATNGKLYVYTPAAVGPLPWPQFRHDARHSGCVGGVGSFCTPPPPVPPTPGPRSKTFTVSPCRVLDTRFSSPLGPIPGGSARSISIAGSLAGLGQGGAADCGVPTGVTGVFVNVVAVGAAGPGHLTLYPFGSALPLASTLNFTTGQTVANGVLVPVCLAPATCTANLTIQMGPAAAHVVIDVTGYLALP